MRDSRHDMHTKQQSLMSKQENQKQVLTSRQDKLSKQDLKYHNKKANLQEQIAKLSQWVECQICFFVKSPLMPQKLLDSQLRSFHDKMIQCKWNVI